MIRKETIQSEGAPSEWPSLSPANWKWLDDVYLLLTGRQGRQNFINTLANSQPNNAQARNFFVNETNGDAKFGNYNVDPYLLTNGNLAVPTVLIASAIETGSITISGSSSGTGSFAAYQTGGQFIPDATPTQMFFNGVTFNIGSGYDTGTGRFTPQAAGKYAVTASLGFSLGNVVVGSKIAVTLQMNGATVVGAASQSSVDDAITANVTYLFDCNGTTDYIDVFAYHNFGVATFTEGTNLTCFFSGFKVA